MRKTNNLSCLSDYRSRLFSIVGIFCLNVFLFCGCKAQKESVTVADNIPVLDNTAFFRSGLAEVSGKWETTGNDMSPEISKYIGNLSIYTDDIITGKHSFRSMAYNPEQASIHNWVKIPTPRIASIRGNKIKPVDIYLEGGKKLDLNFGKENECIGFNGELGRVNRELAGAPIFSEADRINTLIETDTTLSASDVKSMFDRAFKIWSDSLATYLEKGNISDAGKRILTNQPVFQKAFWLLLNEKFLNPVSAEDYSPLREALMTDDNYLLAQKWPGGLVKNLASSALLQRLADNIPHEKDSTLKGAVMKYMRRYDALNLFLGIKGMPELSQLAIARTLCAGGFLKRAKSLDEATDIVAAVANSYIPNQEIRKITEQYARQLFHKDCRAIPDSPEGLMLKDILSKYKGKYVIMDFWGYRCPPCIKEMRDTRDLREKHRGNPDWVILYVTGEDETPKADYEKIRGKYLEGDETLRLSHEIYGRLTAMFEVQEIPRKILFDREGNIIDEYYTFDPSGLPE